MLIIPFVGGLKSLKTKRPVMHFLRGSLMVVANMMFFLGLATMPLAETIALFFTAPLFICILSQPFLGERVGRLRWLVVFIGLIGVIIMLRPGFSVFSVISLLPIFAALAYAGTTIMTRKLGMRDSASALTFYIQIAFITLSLLVGLAIGDGSANQFDNPTMDFLLRAWVWPDWSQIKLLMACGLMVCIGGFLISQAYRLGEAAAVAPFEYASMPFALLVGYSFWGDWPDLVSFLGSALIISSGILIAIYENRRSRLVVNRK
ncbi:MAG: drug/metabolite transporter (DMT)-like permease [Gammaproteobacteria bacterium]|jgi:drug/metabolite transporter (DMT)-like permease